MIKTILVSLALSIFSALAFLPQQSVLAQDCGDSTCVDTFKDICQQFPAGNKPSTCQDKNLGGGNPIYGPQGITTKIFNILSLASGIAAVMAIIFAGLKFVSSGNNPEEVNKAREYIQYAVIGLAVAAVAQLLVRVVLTRVSL